MVASPYLTHKNHSSHLSTIMQSHHIHFGDASLQLSEARAIY